MEDLKKQSTYPTELANEQLVKLTKIVEEMPDDLKNKVILSMMIDQMFTKLTQKS